MKQNVLFIQVIQRNKFLKIDKALDNAKVKIQDVYLLFNIKQFSKL